MRIAFVLLALIAGVACGGERSESGSPAPETPEPDLATLPVAVLRVKDHGEIRVALRPDAAPATVANFEKLAGSGFYEGTTFHRVIPGFMIQGGDPNSKDRDPRDDGLGGPGWKIPDEPSGISHRRGILSMANAGPNTGGSQFFILVADAPHLDGKHTAFGRVVAGMEVVDAIVAVERDEFGRWGPPDRPRQDVVIESVAIEAPK